jgi:DNA phosphorothioation-dependent restriction protein DptG
MLLTVVQKTKTTTVATRNSCGRFASETMPKMRMGTFHPSREATAEKIDHASVTASSLTITYCKTALASLEQDEENSIRHNLEVLMNDKYTHKEDWDGDFNDARDVAQERLKSLADTAKVKEGKIEEITTKLSWVCCFISFSTYTCNL